MAVKRITCPVCGAILKSAASPNPGTRVKCRECAKVFRVAEAEAIVDAIEADESPTPLRKKSRRADPHDDDEHKEKSRPRNKKKLGKPKPAGNGALWALAAGGAAVVLIVLAIGLVAALALTGVFSRPPLVVAKNKNEPPPIVKEKPPEPPPVIPPPIVKEKPPAPPPVIPPAIAREKPPVPPPVKKEKDWGPALSPPVSMFRQFRTSFKANEGLVSYLAISPDGKTLASCGHGPKICFWDLADNTERFSLPGAQRGVNVLAFSPDGKTFASGSEYAVNLWNLDTKEKKELRGLNNVIYALAFSPDGKTIAAGSTAQVKVGNVIRSRIDILTWNVATGDERDELKGKPGQPIAMTFMQDGQLLAVADGEGELTFWDLASKTAKVNVKAHPGGLMHTTATPDGKFLITGGRDRTAKIWDQTGRELATLTGHKSMVGRVAVSRDGQLLAAATGDKYGDDRSLKADEVLLWALPEKRPLAILQAERGAMVSVVFSADGKTLFAGGQDGKIQAWDVPDSAGLKTPDPSPNEATDSAVALVTKLGGKYQRQGAEILQIDLAGAKIADADLDALKDLQWLRRLWLDDAAITAAGLQRLKSCRQLEELSIVRTKVTEKDAVAFKKVFPACYLRWSADDLENAMTNQNYNLATAIKELGGGLVLNADGDIVTVHLSRVERTITDAGLRHFQGLTKIKELSLDGDPRRPKDVTDAGIEKLRGLTSLENLGLSATKITDGALLHVKELRNLKYLNISNTAVTDAGLEHLRELHNLEGVYYGRSKVTPVGIQALKQHLPKCNFIGG